MGERGPRSQAGRAAEPGTWSGARRRSGRRGGERGAGGRGGDCRPPPHSGGGAGPWGVGSSCSRPRHPLGRGSGARVSRARRAAATRRRVERRPWRTQSCPSKRRHAGQRHGAHRGPNLLGPRPAPPLQEPGEGARRAARGCESVWGGRGPGRLRGTVQPNPSPASPGREGPGKPCGPGTRGHRWNQRRASPIPRRCRPALLPARERTLPAGPPGLPGSGSGHSHLRGSALLLCPQPRSRVPACTVRPGRAA